MVKTRLIWADRAAGIAPVRRLDPARHNAAILHSWIGFPFENYWDVGIVTVLVGKVLSRIA
jgi:hypothetical protein